MSLVVLFPIAAPGAPPQTFAVTLGTQPMLRAGYARQLTLKRTLGVQATQRVAYVRKLSLNRTLSVTPSTQTTLRENFIMLRALTTTLNMAVAAITLKILAVIVPVLAAVGFGAPVSAHRVRAWAASVRTSWRS